MLHCHRHRRCHYWQKKLYCVIRIRYHHLCWINFGGGRRYFVIFLRSARLFVVVFCLSKWEYNDVNGDVVVLELNFKYGHRRRSNDEHFCRSCNKQMSFEIMFSQLKAIANRMESFFSIFAIESRCFDSTITFTIRKWVRRLMQAS